VRPAALAAKILQRLLDAIPPVSGAVVMGTGIVCRIARRETRHASS